MPSLSASTALAPLIFRECSCASPVKSQLSMAGAAPCRAETEPCEDERCRVLEVEGLRGRHAG